MLLAGGLLQHGYQCGMIWGAALAAGARAYRLYGSGRRAESAAIDAASKLLQLFRTHNKHSNCFEITDIDKSSTAWQMIKLFLIKGGVIGCIRRAARYAPAAFREADSVLTDDFPEDTNAGPNCASVLARKLGASDLHATMVAGLAGGIGLSGGACGALGAAVWLKGMKSARDGDKKISFDDPSASETVERFLRCTDFQFECSAITGRKFESVEEHAAYIRDGGCAEVIASLADSG